MAQTSTASCPHCRGRVASDPRLAGQAVKCPHCQTAFQMPAPTAALVRWFVARDRQKQGPFTLPQLQQMAASGSIQQWDMLLEEGERTWVRADTISGLFPGKQESSLIPCESCGRLIATAAEACPECGAPNQWVHPEIRRFLQAVGRFSRTPPASYGHVATRLWGNQVSRL